MYAVYVIAALFCMSAQCNRAAVVPDFSTHAPTLFVPSTSVVANDEMLDDFVPYNRSRHDEFDFKLIKTVLSGKPTSNVILSPFSVKLLMSLLAEAAGSNTVTERELASVLPGVNSLFQARELYKGVLRSLQTASDSYDFKIATKIYVSPVIEPRQRFAAIAENYYFTRLEKLDFTASSAAAATINRWVSDATHDRISSLVGSDDLDEAVMIMLNAIYFNGYWRHPFPANETIVAPFFVDHTATAQPTEFMQQTGQFFYLESTLLDAQLLRLPYKGRRFSMTLMLPNAATDPAAVDQLLARLDSESLRRSQYFMDEVEVRMQIPKFRFDHSAPLVPVLQQLGIAAIFTSEASLPLLARGADAHQRLQVSQVLQKAGIEVNEKGSTAFAATEVLLTNKFGGDTTREFVANRPFVFLIEDESTGSLVFAGKVVNPAEFTKA